MESNCIVEAELIKNKSSKSALRLLRTALRTVASIFGTLASPRLKKNHQNQQSTNSSTVILENQLHSLTKKELATSTITQKVTDYIDETCKNYSTTAHSGLTLPDRFIPVAPLKATLKAPLSTSLASLTISQSSITESRFLNRSSTTSSSLSSTVGVEPICLVTPVTLPTNQSLTSKIRYEDRFDYSTTFRKLVEMESQEEKIEAEKPIAKQLDVTWDFCDLKVTATFVLIGLDKASPISLGERLVLQNETDKKFFGFVSKRNTRWSPNFCIEGQAKFAPVNRDGKFTLKRDFNATSYERMSSALIKFVSSKFNENMREILLGNRMPTKLSLSSFDCDNVPNIKLNKSQTNAVNHALQNELCIIQGPPGTGKSTTAAAIVYCMVKSNRYQKKVLVCAPSNVAADNLAKKIQSVGLNVVRMYASKLEEDNKSEIGLHNILMNDQEFRNAKDEFKRNPNSATRKTFETLKSICQKKILSEIDVLCCTCSGAGDQRIDWIEFDSVLIDECAQAPEPVCLVPIVKCTGRVVLIGDQKQLGPVVKCQQALDGGLALSLFERLIELKIPHQLLQVQFRMHPSISSFPSKHFYENQLLDGVDKLRHNLPALKNYWRNSDQNMVFFQTTEKECVSSSGTSLINEGQAKLVQFFIQGLLQKGIKMEQIGVITPYVGQKDLLEVKLGKNLKSIEVATVNAFQGREKDIIIFSTVRCNNNRRVGFLSDLRRLNVAITRAKYGMIIIGDGLNTLKHDKNWNELFCNYQKLGTLVKTTQWRMDNEGFRSSGIVPVNYPKFISKGTTVFKAEAQNDIDMMNQLNKDLEKAKLDDLIAQCNENCKSTLPIYGYNRRRR